MVQHGGGRERMCLSVTAHFREIVFSLDANQLYWLCHTIRYAYSDGKREGTEETRAFWQSAALDKRIKTRKVRGSDHVKLWVDQN
jgi:hypothetical protein